ncbi:MAG TPA: V-type ATP synthase subunit F [Gemmatimonadaceae bacterium]|nr:V-type ATP synthase subunit F [Gemmatimonadaceae bacterium]
MSWTIHVLASPGVAAGFRLAGLRTDEVRDLHMATERLTAAAAAPELGILLVDQALLDAVPDAVRHELERRAVPILVPIPSVRWQGERADAEGYILELLRRAIGYRVRLQ